MASDTVIALAGEIWNTVTDRNSEEAAQLRAIVEGAFAEICEGAWISQPFNVVIGRKPKVAN